MCSILVSLHIYRGADAWHASSTPAGIHLCYMMLYIMCIISQLRVWEL